MPSDPNLTSGPPPTSPKDDTDPAEKQPSNHVHHHPRTRTPHAPKRHPIIRIANRIRDSMDELIERAEDAETGRRDKNGRKTQKWFEHEYEMTRRRQKREERRKRKVVVEEEEEGGDGEKYMMSGAVGGAGMGGSGEGGVDGQGPDFDPPPALDGLPHEGVPMDGPPLPPPPPVTVLPHPGQLPPVGTPRDVQNGSGRNSRHGSRLPAGDRGHASRGSVLSRREVSPMPSEHSASVIRAQVGPRHGGARATTSAPAGRGPPLELDSEDEDPHTSDDDFSVLEGEGGGEARSGRGSRVGAGVGSAATALPPSAHGSRGSAGEGSSSGLRGGGGGGSEGIIEMGDDDLEATDDDESSAVAMEYNEHEDFDDEYRTDAARIFEQQVNDDMTTIESKSSMAQENLMGIDNSKGKYKEEQPDGEPLEKLHQQPQKEMNNVRYGSSHTREHQPYVVTEGPNDQPYGDEGGKARQKQRQTFSHGQMPGAFPDGGFDESDAKPRRNPRAHPQAREHHHDTWTHDQFRRQAKAGVTPEPHFGHNRAGDASQAKPSPKQRFNHEREAHEFPGRGFGFYNKDEERDPQGARAFFDRMRQGSKHDPDPRPSLRVPHFPEPRPMPFKFTDNRPFERRGQHGRRFGGAPRTFQKPQRVPVNHRHFRRDAPRHTRDDFERFDTSDSTEDSSVSGESSDADFLQKRKPRGKKAPPQSFFDELGSDRDEPAPRRRPKAGAGKRRARAESLPRRPSRRPNEGRRRTDARSPPPPRYDDVMTDVPPNHYARLGLSEDATAEEIKKASKKMRIQTHPDQIKRRNPNMTEEELAKVASTAANVGEAADVLEDPRKKREYDETIREWKRRHGGTLPKEDS
ncbi:MAG: hypothetical protein Q9182_000997 [Xanthomendoza sp. 2 TL-2023]